MNAGDGIHVYADPMELNRAGAELFCDAARRAIGERGMFTVALSGGNTPRAMYVLLAGPPYAWGVPWDQVHCFWGDERCVSPDDPQSNFGMACRMLLARVPIPKENLHPVHGEMDPVAAAAEYERELREFFHVGQGELPVFDLVLLGMGEDGHIASLMPHSLALRERERLVVAVDPPGTAMPRVTLTLPVINAARRVVFIVAGPGKAEIVREVLEGPRDPDRFPAQAVQPAGELRWMLDSAAASKLARIASSKT